jgi:hypothetical protein
LPKPLRLFMALFAVVSLTALAACGDDDDEATTETTAERDAEEAAGSDEEAGGEEEGGAPDENPCAEGASGQLGEGGEAPAEGATDVQVTASEYQFAGGDELASTGEYALTLTNSGEELHEAIVVRLSDEETRPIADIIASGDEPEMTEVAFSFACPGTTAEPVAANIEEAGRYVMICFVPVGATPETPPEQFETLGPPHAAQGMVKEFTVS